MAAFSYSPHHDVFAIDVADFPADSYFSSFVASPSASDSPGVIPGETTAGRGEIKLEKKRRDGLQCSSGSSQLKKIKSAKPKKCSEEREIKEPKTGYIHVRARRGQATDSHSLAERARREKIRERMKMLQGLVPGCDKVIGKAILLEEIINYVQSLQNQVEFLSMKLASLNELDLESGGLILSPEKLDEMSLRQTGPHQAIVFADTADSRPIEDSSVSLLMDQDNGDGFAVQVDDNGGSLFNQVGFSRLPSYFC